MAHITKQYDTNIYKIEKAVSDLFGVEDLTKIHELDLSLTKDKPLTQDLEAETYFHKKFYAKLNSGWPELMNPFTSFVQNEITKLIKGPFLYQKTPTFRVHVPNQTAVSKWHYDGDPNHGHPDWEINVQIALTEMKDSSATWTETVPGLGDYYPMNLKTGEYALFDGNRCVHGNYINKTEKTRVSFDFRVIPCKKYDGHGDPSFYSFRLPEVEDDTKYGFVGKLNNKTSFYGRPWDTSDGGYYDFCKNE
jgi:hypothetical protein